MLGAGGGWGGGHGARARFCSLGGHDYGAQVACVELTSAGSEAARYKRARRRVSSMHTNFKCDEGGAHSQWAPNPGPAKRGKGKKRKEKKKKNLGGHFRAFLRRFCGIWMLLHHAALLCRGSALFLALFCREYARYRTLKMGGRRGSLPKGARSCEPLGSQIVANVIRRGVISLLFGALVALAPWC